MCQEKNGQNWQRKKSQIGSLELETDFLNVFIGSVCLYLGITFDKIQKIISKRCKFLVYNKDDKSDFSNIDFILLDFRCPQNANLEELERLESFVKTAGQIRKKYKKPVIAILPSELEFIGYRSSGMVDEYILIDTIEKLEENVLEQIVFIRIKRLLAETTILPFIDTDTGLLTKPLFVSNLEKCFLVHKEKSTPMGLLLIVLEIADIEDPREKIELQNKLVRLIAGSIRREDIKGILAECLIGLVLLENSKTNIGIIKSRIINIIERTAKEEGVAINFKVQDVNYPEDLQEGSDDQLKNRILLQYGQTAGAMLNIALSGLKSQGYEITDKGIFIEEILALLTVEKALSTLKKVSIIGHDIKGDINAITYVSTEYLDKFKAIKNLAFRGDLEGIKLIIKDFDPIMMEFEKFLTGLGETVNKTDCLMKLGTGEDVEEKIGRKIDFQISRSYFINFVNLEFKKNGIHKQSDYFNFFIMKPGGKSTRFSFLFEIEESLPPIKVDSIDNFTKIVIYQMINNSIKYSPMGGRITIRAKKTEDSILLSFMDEGEGISKKNQQKVFNGNRVSQTETDGSGLGLQTLKNYIKEMKGTVEIQSELKKGSTFIVKIPYKKNN